MESDFQKAQEYSKAQIQDNHLCKKESLRRKTRVSSVLMLYHISKGELVIMK
jgi:hypothetical protein